MAQNGSISDIQARGLARRCLRTADEFARAASRAAEFRLGPNGLEDEEAMLFAPAFACGAFAIELAFKASLVRQTGEARRRHELVELFSSLSPPTQQAIRDAMQAARPAALAKYPIDFEAGLAKLNTAFEDWRYVHEHEQLTANIGFMDSLMKASVAVGLWTFGEGPDPTLPESTLGNARQLNSEPRQPLES